MCLGSGQQPTKISVSVANNQKVLCVGTWSGSVQIGGTESFTHFLVFDCGRAFNILLGKWLHKVRGIHNYITDVIKIEGDHKSEQRVAIPNMENEKAVAPSTNLGLTERALLIASLMEAGTLTLDDMVEAEYQQTKNLQAENRRFTESQWSLFLTVDHGKDEDPQTKEAPSKEPLWFTTAAEQRDIAR